MKNRNSTLEVVIFMLIVVAIIGVPLLGLYSAHQESATYNRLTGAKTTWWDALWVELRVQDQPRKEPHDE